MPGDVFTPLRVHSFVGLIPLRAVQVLDPEVLERLPHFRERMDWVMENRPHLAASIAPFTEVGAHGDRELSLVDEYKLTRILERMFDPDEFLSDYGIRSLSRYHHEHPFVYRVDGKSYSVGYEPAESRSGLFGGNSNWRGPLWFPINYLLVEALRKYHHYYGDAFTIEVPTGSGNRMTLAQAADELSRRLQRIFLPDQDGKRAVFGDKEIFQTDPHWRDHLLFYEYFHGDTGAGLGANHQTGWTALVANLIQRPANAPCPYCARKTKE